MDIVATLIKFIEDEFAYDQEVPKVAPDQRLLDSGLVDSVGVLRLAAFIEEKFGFLIQDEDLVPENFETADAIAAFVRSRTAANQ